MSPDRLDALLADLRRRLTALYGERLVRLVLYGSHARGEAREDSDVDVLVVLRGEVNRFEEILRMSRLSVDLDLQHDALVSLLPIASEDFARDATSLARHAREEGTAV